MTGWKDWQIGEVVTETDFQGLIQDQVVQVYATSAARGSALGTAVADGMVSYLTGPNELAVYDGVRWGLVSQAISPNYIINGAFDNWQRGTLFSNPAASTYSADRWVEGFRAINPTTHSRSQQTFTPAELSAIGFGDARFFARCTITTAGGSDIFRPFTQRIEDVRTLAGQTITVSFYAKADSARSVAVAWQQSFGSGGSSPVGSGASTFSLTTSWQRFSFTSTVSSVSGKTIGASSYLELLWQITVADGFVFDIWGVQVEAGSVATPFRRNANSIQGELAACQRYFQRIKTDQNFGYFASGVGSTSTLVRFMQYFVVPMRAIPTLSTQGSFQTAEGGVLTITSISNPAASTNQAMLLDAAVSGAVPGLGYFLRANNDPTAAINLSAEL